MVLSRSSAWVGSGIRSTGWSSGTAAVARRLVGSSTLVAVWKYDDVARRKRDR
jgi:hypothetical protein